MTRYHRQTSATNYTFKPVVSKAGYPWLEIYSHGPKGSLWVTPEDATALLANTDKLRLFLAGITARQPKPVATGHGAARLDPVQAQAQAQAQAPTAEPAPAPIVVNTTAVAAKAQPTNKLAKLAAMRATMSRIAESAT